MTDTGKPDGRWIMEEFARARARNDSLPPHARPVVTRPVVAGGAREATP